MRHIVTTGALTQPYNLKMDWLEDCIQKVVLRQNT